MCVERERVAIAPGGLAMVHQKQSADAWIARVACIRCFLGKWRGPLSSSQVSPTHIFFNLHLQPSKRSQELGQTS